MASPASSGRSADIAGSTAPAAQYPTTPAAGDERSRSKVVKQGYLPVSETSFDKPGAPSPFGDDLQFPLPVSQLTFVPLNTGE